jgi:hypothetical protein
MPPAKFKPARDKSNAELRRAALQRLQNRWNLDNEDGEWEPQTEPTVTPMLQSVEGGIDHCITVLRAHDDDDARAFIEMWDKCSKTDRMYLKLEDIAHAAGVGSLRLAEVCNTALFLYGNMQVQMMLAAGMPQVVARSMKQAKTAKGFADREWMLKAGKILPIPKGAQIAIQNNLIPTKEDAQLESGHTWKYPEDRLKEIVAVTNPKQLEASHVTTGEPIHFDHNKPMVFER